jgi:hypothetical protein
MSEQSLTPQNLDLRDIHLPDPISWWPIAPGWWLLIVSLLLIIAVIFISRKIYLGKQLKRDIISELENIKLQFNKTQNKSQLAKSLSILLRRASISYYPENNIAGLTGNNWLNYLDITNSNASADRVFQSDTGEVLLSAPYLPDNSIQDYDAKALIQLCESWLRSSHKKALPAQPS